MTSMRVAALFCVPLALTACAQQEEPRAPVVRGEPVFNKLGDIVGCEQGVYIPGAQMQYQCYPPPDDCPDVQTATNVPPQCLPRIPRQPGGDPNGGPRRPNPVGQFP